MPNFNDKKNPNQMPGKDTDASLNKNKQQPLPGGARQDTGRTSGSDISQKGKIGGTTQSTGTTHQQGGKQVNPWDKDQRK